MKGSQYMRRNKQESFGILCSIHVPIKCWDNCLMLKRDLKQCVLQRNIEDEVDRVCEKRGKFKKRKMN